MSTTLFEDFVNAELPLRIGTVEVTNPVAGDLPVYKGVGLLTEHKTLAQSNISSTLNLSTDGTFASPSGTTYPSTLAVKTLVDARTAGLLELCSASYDASSNLYPSTGGSGAAGAIVKGDVFFIGTGGVLGGVTVNTGDGVVALVDSPAQTASNWDVFESNLGYTPENIANKSVDGTLSANSDTLYPSQKAVKTYADTKQSSDATLTALAAYNTNGVMVQTAADTFAGRSFADSSDITWTNPAGTAGNISALLTNTAVIAGTYGSGTAIPVLQLDVKGRVVAVSTTPVVMGREIGGGGGNTLSATAVAINCTNCTIIGANTTLINCNGVSLTVDNATAKGSLVAPYSFTVDTHLQGQVDDAGSVTLTTDGGTLSINNAPRANYPASDSNAESTAFHKVKIVAHRNFGGGERQWLVVAERVVKVVTTGVANGHTTNISTIGTDRLNSVGLSFSVTAVNGATSPLNISVAITGGAYGNMIFKAEIESTYIPHT